VDLKSFNDLDPAEATRVLEECCASSAWIETIVSRRPFRDSTDLFTAAEEIWWDLTADDWREAFVAHRAGPSEYATRFGHPYVVHRNGRTDEELAALYARRLEGDPLKELQTSALEQARVTNRSLRELLGGS
jgi:2-oxo-4-hydroxy-4-carboxy-5-ureidoimidazoline decarboxylase